MSKANDTQVGGDHYKTAYQHWDYTADVLEGRYMEGQIAKYISRARKKNGAADYRKAEHFCAKLIEQGSIPPSGSPEDQKLTTKFCADNELTELESFALHTLAGWNTTADLQTVLRTTSFMAQQLERTEPKPASVPKAKK